MQTKLRNFQKAYVAQRARMNRRVAALSLALALTSTTAMAALTVDGVVSTFQAAGYTSIEVKQGPTQIKVEAIMGTTKVEIVYDIESEAILSQETTTLSEPSDDVGVEIKQTDKDFVGEDGEIEDDEDGEDGDDEEGDDEDGDDEEGDDEEGDDDDEAEDDAEDDDDEAEDEAEDEADEAEDDAEDEADEAEDEAEDEDEDEGNDD